MKSKANNDVKKAYALGQISKEEYIQQYYKNNFPSEATCIAQLEIGLKEKDDGTIQEYLGAIRIGDYHTTNLSSVLCRLLKEDWHFSHEIIAGILKEIADPDTVECLYAATEIGFEYLNYDDTYQFARKCIKALAEISSNEAIDKLWILSKSNNLEISEYAKKELKYKNLLL